MSVSVRPKVVAAAFAAATIAAKLTTAAAASDVSPRRHLVEIRKFKFVPARLIIRQGDTVRWINRDIAPHTATETGKRWDTGNLGLRQSARITFSASGSVSYFCRYHPNMRGTVTVIAK